MFALILATILLPLEFIEERAVDMPLGWTGNVPVTSITLNEKGEVYFWEKTPLTGNGTVTAKKVENGYEITIFKDLLKGHKWRRGTAIEGHDKPVLKLRIL